MVQGSWFRVHRVDGSRFDVGVANLGRYVEPEPNAEP
jgi:hypothetical protein